MLIVEGPDGSGKSHLVARILKTFPKIKLYDYNLESSDRNLLHEGNIKLRTLQAIQRAVCPTSTGNGAALHLYDRLFFSELVYGPIVRGECKIKNQDAEVICDLLLALGVPVILCLPPYDIVRQNVSDTRREQMEGVWDNLENIYDAYTELPWIWGANFVRYDYTVDPFHLIEETVISAQHKHDQRNPFL